MSWPVLVPRPLGAAMPFRCQQTPYTFVPPVPDALPEEYVGPSFFITRTTGNCVLTPDIQVGYEHVKLE